MVERSWKRCDVTRFAAPAETHVVRDPEERCARWPLRETQPVLDQLTEDLDPDGRQIVIVTDQEAVILLIAGGRSGRVAAERCGAFVGADWSEDRVGTNGMGTALAEGHAVQIFGPEHLHPTADPWVCSAAVIHDPETRDVLGTIDISGATSDAHPHALGLARLAARSVEAALAVTAAEQRARLADHAGRHVHGGRARAVVRPNGVVVVAADAALVGTRIQPPEDTAGTVLLAGRQVHAELVDGGFVLWPAEGDMPMRAALSLTALGGDQAVLTLDGREFPLSRRRSDVLVLLALHPYGLSDEELAFELYGEAGRAVTVRAEISRLRRDLGPLLTTSPYRLRGVPLTDFEEVERLVRSRNMGAALDHYPGPLLPRSEVPAIVERREALEYMLREAIHESHDPDLLARWVAHPSGAHDLAACRELVARLDAADPRRALAAVRLRPED